MALINCPECGRSVSDKARICPECGYPIQPAWGPVRPGTWGYYGYEFKSKTTVFGMPLIHIVYGPAYGGGLKPAKGFIGIGNIAIGIICIGGMAIGIFTLAGIGLGVVCIGGLALGILAGLGGLATGYLALGGVAIGVYAVGGLSIGLHTLYNDPHIREVLESLFRFRR